MFVIFNNDSLTRYILDNTGLGLLSTDNENLDIFICHSLASFYVILEDSLDVYKICFTSSNINFFNFKSFSKTNFKIENAVLNEILLEGNENFDDIPFNIKEKIKNLKEVIKNSNELRFKFLLGSDIFKN